MDYEETMVEQPDEIAADDTLEEEIVEEQDESEENLDDLMADEEKPAEEVPEQKGPSEPGWIKKRVNTAVQKAIAQTEARMQAMFDQQMAPIREKLLNDEANELVRTGQVKDLETAKELVRYRQGMAEQNQPEEDPQPRKENGQFAPKEDPATMARINMLKHQADKIKASGGPDVIAEWNSNEEIKEKVIAGEMDFYDVAEQMRQATKKRPPSPTRSPNGVNGVGPGSIWAMSNEQFARLDKKLDEGVRFTVKK